MHLFHFSRKYSDILLICIWILKYPSSTHIHTEQPNIYTIHSNGKHFPHFFTFQVFVNISYRVELFTVRNRKFFELGNHTTKAEMSLSNGLLRLNERKLYRNHKWIRSLYDLIVCNLFEQETEEAIVIIAIAFSHMRWWHRLIFTHNVILSMDRDLVAQPR